MWLDERPARFCKGLHMHKIKGRTWRDVIANGHAGLRSTVGPFTHTAIVAEARRHGIVVTKDGYYERPLSYARHDVDGRPVGVDGL